MAKQPNPVANTPPIVLREGRRIRDVQAPIVPIVGNLIRQNPGTISLGQGVVYYNPPIEAFELLKKSLTDPHTHRYQDVEGIPRLREALKTKLREENGFDSFDDLKLIVTAGGNMAFMNAILAITEPHDEIILPVPYYFNHEMAVTMANCQAVLVPTTETYQLRLDKIRLAITPRTRAIVTVSPNNPTGAVYSESTLKELSAICKEYGLYHISDEVYEYFTYGDVKHFSPGAIKENATHTISIFSFSKAFGFAGWRVGYMVIPDVLSTALQKVQDTILVCPPTASQIAALGALEVGAAYCHKQRQSIAEVRQAILTALDQIKDLCVIPPADGAFYLLLRLKTSLDPLQLTERLVREYGVAVTPGTAFGLHDGCYIRVAYGALQRTTVMDGVGRLIKGIRAIVGNH